MTVVDFDESFDIRSIALCCGITVRAAQIRADRERWPYKEKAVRGGKKRMYLREALPEKVQASIARATAPRATLRRASAPQTDQRIVAAWELYDRAKQPLKDAAAQRLTALDSIEKLRCSGFSLTTARDAVAADLQRTGVKGASSGNIARWQTAVEGVARPDWLAFLLPHYAGRTARAAIEPEAWSLFKADYLRLEKPSAESCYRRLQRIAATKATWGPLPSLKTFIRRIERELPRQVRVLAREGDDAFMRTYPAQERDRSMFGALDGVNADGHMFDVFVRFPDGSIGRPVLVGWQDLGSGKILSWRLGESESSDLVRLAFGDMVTTFGIPANIWLDNGRSFASKYLTGGTPTRYRFKVRAEDPVGIMTRLVGEKGVHWVTPYHGQAKPIERAWRDFCDSIAKHPAFAGAYVGNNPTAKPENYGSRAVDWSEFARVLAEEIAAHNAREGRRAKLCAGRSFDAVFAEKYARATIRKASSEQLRMVLLAAEAVTASAQDGSVRLAGNRYWTQALAAHAGRKVVLRFDPMSLHTAVHVYALDGGYIGYAECIASVGFADTNAAREHAQAKKHYRKAAKQMLAAERRMDAAGMAAQMPTAIPTELPEAAAIAPLFGNAAPKPRASLASTGTDDAAAERDEQFSEFMGQLARNAFRNRI